MDCHDALRSGELSSDVVEAHHDRDWALWAVGQHSCVRSVPFSARAAEGSQDLNLQTCALGGGAAQAALDSTSAADAPCAALLCGVVWAAEVPWAHQ
eukprot:5515587-Alexandrium_andersonii.AAC.1